jgi:hypothetical protein
MPRYITLGSYTNEGTAALVDGDSDRRAVMEVMHKSVDDLAGENEPKLRQRSKSHQIDNYQFKPLRKCLGDSIATTTSVFFALLF